MTRHGPGHTPTGGAVPLLNVVLVPAPDQVVVRVTGDGDLSTTPLIADALNQAAGLGTRQVVVDVAAARFWDCSGLHALIEFTAELGAAGRSCRIVGAPANTRRLIELADVAEQLNLGGAVNELPAPNVVAPPAPAAATRSDGARRPVPVHEAPAAGLAVPARG
jgi:anti-anti-sigma factor